MISKLSNFELTWSKVVPMIERVNRLYIRHWHEVKASPTSITVPQDGPVLVVGNHLSALDPFIIQAHFPRFIHWMVAKEYYEYPLFKWFLKPLDLIPVNRGSKEPGPLRVALRMLKEGKVVGIFPEATWATGTEVLPFEPGASVLAQRPGVTTFLAALDGTVRNTTLGESLLQPMEVRLILEAWNANVSQERLETKKMKKSSEDEKKIVAPDPLQQAMIRMVSKLRSHG